jgi:DNA-cytosine methyltransferase
MLEAGGDYCIRVGSDCTGYGSDYIALSLLKDIKPQLIFVAEINPEKRELMRATHADIDFSNVIMYHDIMKRDNASTPYVDLFFTGAPCQAWSHAGARMGLDDVSNRGVVIFHSLDYIRVQRPRVAILENVKGLSTGNNKQILQQIVGILKDLGYTVEWKVLNTKDHGVPQSRPRLYIVAIRTRFLRSPISFPGTTKMIDLAQFLDTDDVRSTTDEPITKCFSEAITKAKDKFGQKTLDESFVIIDTAASEKYSTAMLGCVPCITKSRGRLGTLSNSIGNNTMCVLNCFNLVCDQTGLAAIGSTSCGVIQLCMNLRHFKVCPEAFWTTC